MGIGDAYCCTALAGICPGTSMFTRPGLSVMIYGISVVQVRINVVRRHDGLHIKPVKKLTHQGPSLRSLDFVEE